MGEQPAVFCGTVKTTELLAVAMNDMALSTGSFDGSLDGVHRTGIALSGSQ
jgi:hypothetical protein